MLPDQTTALFLPLGIAAAVHAVISLGLVAWGRWVARRQETPLWWTFSWMPALGFGVSIVGLSWTTARLVQSFQVIATYDAALKAQALAEGISSAMRASAVCVPIAVLLYLGSGIAFTVGSIRKRREP